MDCFAIHEDAVLGLPMVIQPFPVIGEHDNDGAVVDIHPLERRDEGADDGVGRSDLAVVRISQARAKRLLRLVRRVRLEQMEHEEEWTGCPRRNPALGELRGFASGPLHLPDSEVAATGDRVLVEIERGPQAGAATQYECRDGRACVVPPRLQQPRQGRNLRVQHVPDVVPHLVLVGEHPCQQGNVRGQGQRDVGVGVTVEDCVPPECIQVRRFRPFVPVHREPVST